MTTPNNPDPKLPPHHIESEAGVLACCLIDPGANVPRAIERLKTAEAFYDVRHQAIFTAIIRLSDASSPVDEITIDHTLRETKTLDQAGGVEYVTSLRDVTETSLGLDFYLEVVHEKLVLRHALRTCAEVGAKIYSHEGTANDLLEHIDQRMMDLALRRAGANEVTIKQVMSRVVSRMEEYHRGRAQMTGHGTGIDYLDKMTSGLAPAQMWVLAGRPGGGKTSLGMNIVDHVAVTCQIPTLVFSLEMTSEELGQRLLFARARADMQRFRTGFFEESDLSLLGPAIEAIGEAPLYIDDDGSTTISDIRAKARRLHHQHGIRLVMIDYVQLIRGNTRYHSRLDEVADISHSIKALAKELKIPIIVLAQMNREIEKDGGKRLPRLSDLRECGDIEQDADLVGLLYDARPKERESVDAQGRRFIVDEAEEWAAADWSKTSKRVNLLIGKQRNGPTGDVELLFRKSSMRFDPYQRPKATLSAPAKGKQDSGAGYEHTLNTDDY